MICRTILSLDSLRALFLLTFRLLHWAKSCCVCPSGPFPTVQWERSISSHRNRFRWRKPHQNLPLRTTYICIIHLDFMVSAFFTHTTRMKKMYCLCFCYKGSEKNVACTNELPELTLFMLKSTTRTVASPSRAEQNRPSSDVRPKGNCPHFYYAAEARSCTTNGPSSRSICLQTRRKEGEWGDFWWIHNNCEARIAILWLLKEHFAGHISIKWTKHMMIFLFCPMLPFTSMKSFGPRSATEWVGLDAHVYNSARQWCK